MRRAEFMAKIVLGCILGSAFVILAAMFWRLS